MNDLELGWLVGIFEGEGCININKPDKWRRKHQPRLTVQMTDEDTLRRFAAVAGIGQVTGPQYRVNPAQKKPLWRWQVAGRAAIPLLELMLPHLGLRRAEQARVALGFAYELRHHAGLCRKDGSCCLVGVVAGHGAPGDPVTGPVAGPHETARPDELVRDLRRVLLRRGHLDLTAARALADIEARMNEQAAMIDAGRRLIREGNAELRRAAEAAS